MALNLIEIVEQNTGGMTTAVSQEEGAATATYRLSGADANTPPTVTAMNQAFDFFTGGVANLEPKVVTTGTAGAGKVVRVLPPVHPFRPELSCAGVDSMVGVGQHLVGTSTQVYGLTPITATFPHYLQYDYRVKLVKRPYFLLPDEKIEVKTAYYYPPDGSSGVPFYYAEEWRRFTSQTRVPTGETVSASFGQLTFRTQSGSGEPNNTGYTGAAFQALQNELIELTWYNVPYRYMLDVTDNSVTYRSYLTRFVNCVNQNAWNGHAPGTLLYLGASPVSYIPAGVKVQKFLQAIALGLDQNLMMNVKLRFLKTSREGTDVPNSAHALLTNKNNVAAGHNLFPNFPDRRFYYVAGDGATDADKRAAFASFPFELFFTDPMLVQQGGTI